MLEFIGEFAVSVIEKTGYLGIFILMFFECSFFPVPSEIVMPFSGFVASKGTLNFWLVVLVGTLGQMLGATALYYFGRWEGRPLLEKYGKYILIKKKELDHADKMFAKHGEIIVFLARFLPGIRMVISLPAGVSKMSYFKFLGYSTLGIIPFTLFLTYLGVKMGENWLELKSYFHIIEIIILAVLGLMVMKFIMAHIKRRKEKNAS